MNSILFMISEYFLNEQFRSLELIFQLYHIAKHVHGVGAHDGAWRATGGDVSAEKAIKCLRNGPRK